MFDWPEKINLKQAVQYFSCSSEILKNLWNIWSLNSALLVLLPVLHSVCSGAPKVLLFFHKCLNTLNYDQMQNQSPFCTKVHFMGTNQTIDSHTASPLPRLLPLFVFQTMLFMIQHTLWIATPMHGLHACMWKVLSQSQPVAFCWLATQRRTQGCSLNLAAELQYTQHSGL